MFVYMRKCCRKLTPKAVGLLCYCAKFANNRQISLQKASRVFSSGLLFMVVNKFPPRLCDGIRLWFGRAAFYRTIFVGRLQCCDIRQNYCCQYCRWCACCSEVDKVIYIFSSSSSGFELPHQGRISPLDTLHKPSPPPMLDSSQHGCAFP